MSTAAASSCEPAGAWYSIITSCVSPTRRKGTDRSPSCAGRALAETGGGVIKDHQNSRPPPPPQSHGPLAVLRRLGRVGRPDLAVPCAAGAGNLPKLFLHQIQRLARVELPGHHQHRVV